MPKVTVLALRSAPEKKGKAEHSGVHWGAEAEELFEIIWIT